ncbi:MAG TPA: RHS repeat-associated core domain-containing protein [Pyrinomonadaceae bacterium]
MITRILQHLLETARRICSQIPISSAIGSRAAIAGVLILALTWSMVLPFTTQAAPKPVPQPIPAEPAEPATINQVTETFSVYGPQRFTRLNGQPVNNVQNFSLPSGAIAPFNIRIENGAPEGSNRVSSATIKLNGSDLFTPSDFSQNVSSLAKAITLTATNTLEVKLTSAAGSYLTVTITATRNANQPTLTSVSPVRTTQGQILSVTLQGTNTHWVAGQTRASLGGEVGVGGAGYGELGPVTVLNATTAVAAVVVSPTAALEPRVAQVSTPLADGTFELVTLTNGFTVDAVTPPGSAATKVSTIAGGADSAGYADGDGTTARFRKLSGIAVGPNDTIYVADAGNQRIRMVVPSTGPGPTTWTVSTLAGNGTAGFADGAGAAAMFNNPQGIAVGPSGTVYVADTANNRIRRIAANGTVTTLAGDGTSGLVNGAGNQARFNAPQGVATDGAGNVYVADTGNAAIRKIDQAGTVTSLAGDGSVGSNDSPGARFDGLVGVAVEGQNIYVYLGDSGNHRIRRLDVSGTVITIGGAERGFRDGSAAQARFAEPSGIAIDSDGKIVIADAVNSLIRSVDPDLAGSGSNQAVSTLAGTGIRGLTDGNGDVARFFTPRGLAISNSSAIIIADTGNQVLRRLLLPPIIHTLVPASGRAGDTIEIHGARFDARGPERNVVRFTKTGGGQTFGSVTQATHTVVTVVVPADAATGSLTVETEGGTAAAPTDFVVNQSPAPTIADFNPKRGTPGTQVTLTGSNLKVDANDPAVTFAGSGGSRVPALVNSASATEVHVTVPNGAFTGQIELSNAGGTAATASPFTVDTEQDFQLTTAPSTATAVQGGAGTYIVYVTSAQNTFSQIATLTATGLPAGITATFNPAQITSGSSSTLTVQPSGTTTPGSYPFTIHAVASIAGNDIERTAGATLNVMTGGVTTLSGRVLSTDSEPIIGATASLDGHTAMTDAAGSFLLSGINAGSSRPLMIDGRTASSPNKTYPIIIEPANIVAGQANINPYTFYLPPIDTQYEVEVVPGQNTVASNPRIPGLQMTIPAGANLRNRDGSPVTRVSITPLAIDRTPAPLPPNIKTAMVFTSQPGGALSDTPMPVTYPNTLGVDPGTRVSLYAFNHDTVQWYVYGFGRVSTDGKTISPEINPATGQLYGLPDFSWHFPAGGPGGDPGGPGPDKGKDCSDGGTGGNPVDYSTGMKIEQVTDASFGGPLGGVQLVRIYTSDMSAQAVFGRFGRGSRDNFDVQLTGNWVVGGAGRVRMPYDITGQLYNYSGTDTDGALLFTTNTKAGQLGDAVRKLTNGTFEYRFAEGNLLRFNSSQQLTAVVDRNGNATTLGYSGGILTTITDPVGRSLTLTYSGGSVSRVTDPIGRVWNYTYGAFNGIAGFLANVSGPLNQSWQYSYTNARLSSVTDPRGIVTKRITYDGNGRVIAQQFADGGTEHYEYDLSGITVTATRIIDTMGRVNTRRFNASGYILSKTDPFGQTSQINRDLTTNLPTSNVGPCGCPEATRTFDAKGNPTETTDRAGRTVKAEYDPVTNKITRIQNKAGQVTTYHYDGRGNLLSTTNALNETTTLTYGPNGLLASVSDALGHTSRIEYDAQGNISAQIDALNNRTTIEYDGIGRPTAIVDPLGRRSEATYDARDRLITFTDPSGAVTRFEYDNNGNRTAVIDALNHKWTQTYDAKGRLTSATDPLNRVTRFFYNASDEIVRAITPSGRTVQYTYDVRGMRSTVTDPSGGVVTFKYDSNGRLAGVRDQRGNVTTFLFDELQRLIGMRDPLGRLSSIVYDNGGNVARTVDRLGRLTQYTYDVLNRPTHISYPDAEVNFQYNAAGLPSQVSDTQGGSITWAYDAANQLTAETTGQGEVHYTYNASGQRLSMTAADRQPVSYGYDAAGRLQTIQQGTETYTHGYDQLSRRTSLLRPNGVTTTYAYDAVGRISRLSHSNASNQALEDYQYGYTIDNEISSVVSLSAPGAAPAEKTSGPADAANRVRQFGSNSYDFNAVGQTTQKTNASGTTQYNWDARGRMTGATLPTGASVNYTYDVFGRRTSRSAGGVTTQFLHDGSEVVLDRENGGNPVDYLNGAGVDEHLRQSSVVSGTLYPLQDHLGSIGALTDVGGNVVERMQYEPFGGGSGSTLTRYGYAGRERDGATGLLYYRARWYDSEQGRFLSEDPAGLAVGLNLYTYAGNNPIFYNDPFGLSIGTFFEGLAVGVFEGVASAILAYFVLGALSAAAGATGGAALAVALALLAAYGLYQIYEEAKAIAEIWDKCPDERDYRLGRLVGQIVGALLGGKAMSKMGAGAGAGEGGCPTCKGGQSCFVAGTLVQTSQGEKRIEEVHPGDVVFSLDPQQQNASSDLSPEPQNVTRTFVRTAPVVVDIHVGNQTITATPEHPFWVIGAGWTAAGELRRGSALLTKDGVIVHIDYVDRRKGLFQVYNFEVSNAHTYYVSSLGVLVHNQCSGPKGGNPGEPPPYSRSEYPPLSQAQKDAALAREPTCQYCGNRPSTQVDHIESLKQDWQNGGWQDTPGTRGARVNDPNNLTGSCQPCNGSKGAKPIGQGPGQWWPPGW